MGHGPCLLCSLRESVFSAGVYDHNSLLSEFIKQRGIGSSLSVDLWLVILILEQKVEEKLMIGQKYFSVYSFLVAAVYCHWLFPQVNIPSGFRGHQQELGSAVPYPPGVGLSCLQVGPGPIREGCSWEDAALPSRTQDFQG